MTNFTVKNNFKAENVKLLDAVTCQDEDGTWYIELKYEYEDESGIHVRYYPKIEFPFFCGKLPPEEFSSDRFGHGELTISLIANEVAVHRGNFWNPMSGKMMNDVCVVDNLVKPAVHNMTIEEIEKELGYKINIINKENNNES
jgi:hypothetical protein